MHHNGYPFASAMLLMMALGIGTLTVVVLLLVKRGEAPVLVRAPATRNSRQQAVPGEIDKAGRQ